jgi:erythromycin esterase-like protein
MDAALADTGRSLFALDFRTAPNKGVVRKWLATPHRMGSIGAVFNELSPTGPYFAVVTSDTFDVIVFVNQTTPAREDRELPHEMDTDFDRG